MDFVRLWIYYRPDWPIWLYAFLLFVILIIILLIHDKLLKKRAMGLYLLTVYLAYIVSITVLNREPFIGTHFEPQIFWSYREILSGDFYYIEENLLNVFMLMPIGLLIPIIIDIPSDMWQYVKIFIIGSSISLIIETLQLVSQRGLFEFDDIFHNTLGCLIGYGICRGCIAFLKVE